MNYSTAVFLINPSARAIRVSYDGEGKDYLFKTLDTNIKVDDLVVIPTNTRHNATVGKVSEVDVDVDFDSNIQLKWVICTIDKTNYDHVLAQEAQAIEKIKSAEMRNKREELAKKLLANTEEELKSLQIANPTPNAEKAA